MLISELFKKIADAITKPDSYDTFCRDNDIIFKDFIIGDANQ